MNLTAEMADNTNQILPAGYQPFMRCHSQHAYAIHMREASPLQDDISFEKLYFKQDERLSKEIFERMDFGRKIYPQEGLDGFADIINKIKNTTVFSKAAYTAVLDTGLYYTSDAEARNALREIDIIEDSPIRLSRQRIRKLNRQYEGFSIEKAFGIKLLSRPIYIPN